MHVAQNVRFELFGRLFESFWYKKVAPNRAVFYSVQASGTNFLYKFIERVSHLLIKIDFLLFQIVGLYNFKQDATLSQGWPRDVVVHFDIGPTATCGFSATARIACWSSSADCCELSVNQIDHVRVNVSRDLKLFGREIIFEVFQPV